MPDLDRRYGPRARDEDSDVARVLLCVPSHTKDVAGWHTNQKVKYYRKSQLEATQEQIRIIFEDADDDAEADAQLVKMIAAQEERTKTVGSVRVRIVATRLTSCSFSADSMAGSRTTPKRAMSAL